MKLRQLIFALIAVLALFAGSIVSAQEDFDPCFGLSEDDCAVINEASTNGIGDVDSFTLDASIDFAADGLAAIAALAGGSDPEEMGPMADLESMTFTFDGSFDFAMDEMSALGLNMAGGFTTSYGLNGESEERAYELVIAEDQFFFNMNDEGWQSINLLELLEDEDLAGTMEDVDPSALEDLAGGMSDEDMEMAMGSLGLLFEILDLPGFITYTRAGDVFDFNIDFSVLQLLLEEENEDLLNELVTTASEVDPSLAFFIPAIPTLISDGNINVVQTVDTGTNTLTGLTFETNLDIALGALAGTADVTTVALVVDFNTSNLDSVSPTAAPADAEDVTEDFAGLISAFAEGFAEGLGGGLPDQE